MAGDPLVGKMVLVPPEAWPELDPPEGEEGWEGLITKKKKGGQDEYYVSFPDDPAMYFFKASILREWVIDGKKKAAAKKKHDTKTDAHSSPTKPPSKVVPAKRKSLPQLETSAKSPELTRLDMLERGRMSTGATGVPNYSPTQVAATKAELVQQLKDLASKMSIADLRQIVEQAKVLAQRQRQ